MNGIYQESDLLGSLYPFLSLSLFSWSMFDGCASPFVQATTLKTANKWEPIIFSMRLLSCHFVFAHRSNKSDKSIFISKDAERVKTRKKRHCSRLFICSQWRELNLAILSIDVTQNIRIKPVNKKRKTWIVQILQWKLLLQGKRRIVES